MTCFTVSGSPQSHIGGGDFVKRKEWVRRVCPILNLVRTTSWYLLGRLLESHRPISGLMDFNLLFGLTLFHSFCQEDRHIFLMKGDMSSGVMTLRSEL